ncbi:hypothetical protein EDD21DRAFT_84191 [Dissophora ornata]|nr:hypothetical protein EDD21DRAFT_84191 [Dissophora ornata]
MEQRKDKAIYNSASISSIETNLPHLRGTGASIKEYVGKLKDVEAHLDSFYNSNMVLKKHRWNARKARDEEYLQIANRLFKLVGGSIGAKREDSNKVVIGVGLGKFSTKTRLSSLHESFQSYFVQIGKRAFLYLRGPMVYLSNFRTNIAYLQFTASL